MTHAPNSGIEELYRSVIQDVIEQSKEAFLDENIDADILFQIQKAWEEKINASGAADLNPKVQPVPAVRPAQVKQQRTATRPNIPQLDGGPHMSDSSSDDEEDDDPLSRMVNRIDDKAEDDDEGGDEDPLNSADDQSDDEDLDTLFQCDNIIVCQFEKVNRARNKWKFNLKDGVMHLEGKDYCFQKCTGEAEW
uniref:TFIIA n=1 Tax=Panagrolaimus sp. PS1159 TaxID=55785 RepID=A0AC35G1B6_9BILA